VFTDIVTPALLLLLLESEGRMGLTRTQHLYLSFAVSRRPFIGFAFGPGRRFWCDTSMITRSATFTSTSTSTTSIAAITIVECASGDG